MAENLAPMANFKLVDRDTSYLLPPSVDEWLPEDHLARFVVEITDQLDISALEGDYSGSGSGLPSPADATGAAFLQLRHGHLFLS